MIGQPEDHEPERWPTADVSQPAPAPSDIELIESVRGGAVQAYGQLYERHVHAAHNLARHLVRSRSEADDLVSDAFAKVLDTLRAGGGPDSAFRAYLLTALRHTAYDKARRDRRIRLADDVEAVSGAGKATAVPFHDPALAMLEQSLATKAFASLPERWQAVLWQTEIEGQTPAEVAPLLGLTTNGVSALAYRAREGLKKAYLQAHLAHSPTARCRATVAKLGAWTRAGLSRRETAQVEAHLDECAGCRALAAELADVNGTLRAVVAPLVLGLGTAGYLATTAAAAKAGTAVGAVGAGGSVGVAHTVTSASHWLGAAASTTALVAALVWSTGTEEQVVAVPTTSATPPPPSAARQAPTPMPRTLSPGPGAPSAGVPVMSEPSTGVSEPVLPETTTETPVEPPLVPVVPDGFTVNTGGPPVDLPVTIRNTGPTSVPAPVLVLALPEGVRAVGSGDNFAGGRLVGLDGAGAQPAGCSVVRGAVRCTADHDLAAGGSVTFVLRLLAGPKAVGGTITGTVTAGPDLSVGVEIPVAVKKK